MSLDLMVNDQTIGFEYVPFFTDVTGKTRESTWSCEFSHIMAKT